MGGGSTSSKRAIGSNGTGSGKDKGGQGTVSTRGGVMGPLPPPPSTAPLSSSALAEELERVGKGLVASDGAADAVNAVQLEAARRLRQLLSSNRDPIVLEVLDRNWIPLLLELLRPDKPPDTQVEALWALTNIAAGTSEHTPLLVNAGAIPILVKLLSSEEGEVVEQAMWVLGNLAGEGAATRDTVLNAGAMARLVKCLERSGNVLSLQRIGSWTLSNLFDGQPRPQFDIAMVMPTLSKLLASSDSEVLSHTCWALSHLCDGPSAHIKAVVEAGTCWRLVELLMHRSWRVAKPALRTIGNIVCAEDDTDYTQYIIEAGAVPRLRLLIGHNMKEICKEACWTLSNIAAGTAEQIQTVLDSGVMPQLISLAVNPNTDNEVRSEAHWVVLNAASCGSDAQIEYLVSQGCVPILGDLLGEGSMVLMALEGLERVLQVGDSDERRLESGGSNPYAAMLSPTRVKRLEKNKSSAIAKRASRIWKMYFVTCAICENSFSRHAPDTRFCDECQCVVCTGCDCSVFHLSYQEQLWDTLEGKETSEKQAKTAAKKSKKAKRKAKAKEKKAAAEVELEPEEHAPHDEMDGDGEIDGEVDAEAEADVGADSPHKEKQEEGPECMPPPKLPKELVNDELLSANDDLVDYLQQTGSILALAQLLDDEEDEIDGDGETRFPEH